MLLESKLNAPRLRPQRIPRPRLIDPLEQGLTQGRVLTLVSAPAGYGKSMLVGEWLAERAFAWLSLDESDNDPIHFLNYLVAALQRIVPVSMTEQTLYTPSFLRNGIVQLTNDLLRLPRPVILVLDDYHLITTPEVHSLVQLLLEQHALHLVICTREDPPLPLARLRALDLITEIRQKELRFTGEETAAFLNQTMRLKLAAREIAVLEARTEGWVAGLQLAALAMRQNEIPASIAGSDRYIVDYLVAEVLQHQPPEIQEFLQKTAVLERLTAPLCESLTGNQNSQAVLEHLDMVNLFLIPLDHHRKWYRYHPLFREFLQAGLPSEIQKKQHLKAAVWYEAHGYIKEAIHHTLLAEDFSQAQRLITADVTDLLLKGEIRTVQEWVKAIPDALIRENGRLAMAQAWVLFMQGSLEQAIEYKAAAAACFDRAETPVSDRTALLILSGNLALGQHDYDTATTCAAQALEMQPEAHWRIIALWILAEAQERLGNIEQTIRSLRQITQIPQHNLMFNIVIESFLVAALDLNGRWHEARTVCEQAIARYTDSAGQISPIGAVLYARLGILDYEANNLPQARAHLEKAAALADQLGLNTIRVFCLGSLVPVMAACGETDAALKFLQDALLLAEQDVIGETSWVYAYGVNLYLQLGQLAAAQHVAERISFVKHIEPNYLHIEAQISLCRLMLAEGQASEAQKWLSRLEKFLSEHALNRWLLSVSLLQGKKPLPLPGYTRLYIEEKSPPETLLSDRELEVLHLLTAGCSNSEIAARLFITVGTVKRHVNNIYDKLDVRSRTQAAAKARALGLL